MELEEKVKIKEETASISVPQESAVKASMDVARIYETQKQQLEIKLKKEKVRKGRKGKKSEEKVEVVEHELTLQELAEKFQTNINFDNPKESSGLTSSQARELLAKYGPNKLTPAKTTPMWVKFLKQFLDFFPLLLEAGGILCLIAWGLERKTANPTNDNLYLGIILWLVVIVTAIFSFMQEAKSARVMDGFAKLAPQAAKVYRDGKLSEIEATNLVIGDIVFVKSGDKVPADIRIIWALGMKVDNSSLTGESEPQTRSEQCTDENYFETHNIAFFSTLVQEGEAVGVVYRTGDNTEMGTIANLASGVAQRDTPLRKEISRFIKIISVVAISLGIIFLIVGFVVKINWIANIVFMIGIIVANVPEGLLPTVTVGLTLTAKRLATKKVLVKNLEAVETLGSCSTICSDKTGTLTMNRMTVVHLYYDTEIFTVDDIATTGAYNKSAETFKNIEKVGILCNRAVFDSNNSENASLPISERKTVGDASESALIKFFEPFQPIHEFRSRYPKVAEIPFNSSNKWQLSIHETEQDTYFMVMKGAPERVIEACDTIMVHGKLVKLRDEERANFEKAYENLAGHGERVLGLAILELNPKDFPPNYEFNIDAKNFPTKGLVFVGLAGLMDPPKPSVPEAVTKCQQAGVRVIMVTGDHPLTAAAIARQVGIIQSEKVDDIDSLKKQMGEGASDIPEVSVVVGEKNAVVIKGSEIPSLTPELWEAVLSRRQVVFARTTPEQKLQIVTHCQKRGEIVAVTGDGVNDSPALKQADLGCAMGISGSDVSKEAADVILLDDNFASIVAGIEEGRIIFENLKKSICYTLSSNSAELLPFISFAVLQMPLALSAVLILCIDLGTDMIPAISLAYENPESDIMKRPPRKRSDRLVTAKLAAFSYIWLGLIQSVAGYIAFFLTMGDYGFSAADTLWISTKFFRPDSESITATNGEVYDEAAQRRILSEAQTAFFVAVVITRMACVIITKTRKLSVFKQKWTNWVFNLGLLFEISLVLILSYVPGITTVFSTRPVGWKVWVTGIPFFCFVVASDEFRKWLLRRYPNGRLAALSW